MKRTILLLTAALGAAIAAAQQPAPAPTAAQPRPTDRVRRTETVPYDTRHDAEARDRAASGHTIDFRPEVRVATEGPLYAVLGQQIEIPYVWTDGCAPRIRSRPTSCGSTTGGWPTSTTHSRRPSST